MSEKRGEIAQLNDRQRAILVAIAKGLNGGASTDGIASRLGYRPAHKGRLAVHRTLKSLALNGYVGSVPPQDQWGRTRWFLMSKGQQEGKADE